MASLPSISLISSTHNRAPSLRQTLGALGKVKVLPDWQAELIVVDNASTDDTARVIRSAKFANRTPEYLYEPLKGKSNALNAAFRRAEGEIILLIDDDVSVAEDWVEQMIAAFEQDQADAVVGKIVLAENLSRPWLTPLQKWWLAAPDNQAEEQPGLIGANMGFRRKILQRVPAFDPEIGAGTAFFGEEALFGKQLVEAGFKIKYAPNAVVVHRPDESRLRRYAWIDAARKKGHEEAYFRYHWQHEDIRAPRASWLWYALKLRLRRIFQQQPPLESEGIAAWEMSYVQSMETCRQFSVERRRPRNYARRGLLKSDGLAVDSQPLMRADA
ncbi:MAG: glycosyltransferase family 2 protein [Verrucomicrobia bacterium]|nr:glycosyltransferase family 2 protein [Verrucomicrobiota bacterium]